MAVKKVGTLIKEARTKAGLTQEQLAKQVAGVTAADISKAERGEKELTEAQLKAIAKATGVTQKSLLEAPKGGTASAASGQSSSGSTKLSAEEKKLIQLYRKADDKTKQAVIELFNEGAEETGSILTNLLGGGGGSSLSGIGGFLGSLLGGGSNNNSGGSGKLLGSLLGGGNSGGNSSGGSGNLLGSLLGGVLGGKREMPEGEGEAESGDLPVYKGGEEK